MGSARVPFSIRLAQILLVIPLGLFQGTAAVFFSLTMPMKGADYLVAGWAVVMTLCDVVAGVGLSRGAARYRRMAFVLLAAQTAFALVKLLVYHESASFVFLALVAATAAALAAPGARRFFRA